MANNFKYHIRKSGLQKNKKDTHKNVHIYQHTHLGYISSYSPHAPDALTKPDNLVLPFSGSMTMSYMCLMYFPNVPFFPYCHHIKPDQSLYSHYQIPLLYETKSKGKRSFPSLMLFSRIFFSYGKFRILRYLYNISKY